ncbi:endopolyphosphatase [Malassezia vespertilionis]|uniref:endopolyphosphatase n=1 Tax=Malassezia vespertilionis TaxID=2020962 RepID=UPI0024B1EDC8|nr:endopolyphosphatase [Malassezia vespertilionis]WFD04820.1 endopolyphosphatase [Malassezia vespertilionis]
MAACRQGKAVRPVMRVLAYAAVVWAAISGVYCEQVSYLLEEVSTRAVAGRFVHITDMHLDKHYQDNASIASSCHRISPNAAQRAGHWGTPLSDCDSPRILGNASLAWLRDNWRSEENRTFDFILWTGDSVRHDNDKDTPRTVQETMEAVRFSAQLLQHYFPGIPIVPNLGNNDVFKHNIMLPGHSKELDAFLDAWRDLIPHDMVDSFRKGGYFATEVIPNTLGVISLNTLYFYDTNSAVAGCPRRVSGALEEEADIGTVQLEWLMDQLLRFRQRNMQVHIIGHVPPTFGKYFPRCFDAYTELVIQFQDTIVGQHFGHMNMDMFFVQKSKHALKEEKRGVRNVPKGIESDLKYEYGSLPTPAQTNESLYSVFYVSGSIIPTYLPSMRVWTYNTTQPHRYTDTMREQVQTEATRISTAQSERKYTRPDRETHSKHDHEQPRFVSDNAPSRTNMYLTLLGYSEWTANLDAANQKYDRMLQRQGKAAADALSLVFDLAYTTYHPTTLWHDYMPGPNQALQTPVPKHLLDAVLKKRKVPNPIECNRHGSDCKSVRALRDLSDYALADMTLGSLMQFARRLVANSWLWNRYVHRMYAGIPWAFV